MDASRSEEILRRAKKHWQGRLVWVAKDRQDDDFVFYVGVEECSLEDEEEALNFTVSLVPADREAKYSHIVFAVDSRQFNRLEPQLQAQIIFNRR